MTRKEELQARLDKIRADKATQTPAYQAALAQSIRFNLNSKGEKI